MRREMRLVGSPLPAKLRIAERRDDLKMIGIHAAPIVAFVIDLKTSRYGSDKMLIGPAMGPRLSARAVAAAADAKATIAVSIAGERPLPTAGSELDKGTGEAIEIREQLPCHARIFAWKLAFRE